MYFKMIRNVLPTLGARKRSKRTDITDTPKDIAIFIMYLSLAPLIHQIYRMYTVKTTYERQQYTVKTSLLHLKKIACASLTLRVDRIKTRKKKFPQTGYSVCAVRLNSRDNTNAHAVPGLWNHWIVKVSLAYI